MKNLTKTVLVALAAIALASTVAILSPRPIHAATETPVLAAGYPRYPWSGNCTAGPTSGTTNPVTCTIEGPSGAELVIQTITLQGYAEELGSVVTTTVSTTTGGNPAAWTSLITASANAYDINIDTVTPALHCHGCGEIASSFATTLYADPNISSPYVLNHPPIIVCSLQTPTSTPATGLGASHTNPSALTFTLVGYYVINPVGTATYGTGD